MIRHTVLALVRDQEGLILGVYNPKRQFYTLPGGKREEYEGPLETCVRELREETGLLACEAQHCFSLTGPACEPAEAIDVYNVAVWVGEATEREPGCRVFWFLPPVFFGQVGAYASFYAPLWRKLGL